MTTMAPTPLQRREPRRENAEIQKYKNTKIQKYKNRKYVCIMYFPFFFYRVKVWHLRTQKQIVNFFFFQYAYVHIE